MVVDGVDYSFDQPDVAALAASGKQFACRYVGPGSSAKHLTATEVAKLTSHNMWIVANAEGTEGGLIAGAVAGATWARSGYTHARQLGMPANRPVYLSVDFDLQMADWPAVRSAFLAAFEAIGRENVGAYGGYLAIDLLAQLGVPWLWQTYAWSQGRWHPKAQIQQFRNGVYIGGGTVDLDRVLTGVDYGQWIPGKLPTQVGKAKEMDVLRVRETGAIWVSDGPWRYTIKTEAHFNAMMGGRHLTYADLVHVNSADLPGWGQDAATADDEPSTFVLTDQQLQKLMDGMEDAAFRAVQRAEDV